MAGLHYTAGNAVVSPAGPPWRGSTGKGTIPGGNLPRRLSLPRTAREGDNKTSAFNFVPFLPKPRAIWRRVVKLSLQMYLL